MKIKIIAEKSWGYKDTDHSIEILDEGELVNMIKDEDIPNYEPIIGELSDYKGYTMERINGPSGGTYTVVDLNPIFFVWAYNRKEWVGIKKDYIECISELDGNTENIETAGPFKLNEKCARLIKQAYKSNIPDELVLYTPPSQLSDVDV